ncbi:YARHG domain-containing protein [Lentilitoribacter sp. EG35]|uniref:YARHG domain-containing protein n=1 Tax=Lentilitoribacter sp. EG35 TaxID=3234192 RepID=UPI00345FBC5A
MSSHKSYGSFGEYFTAIMRERGFRSDEQLARRAMQVQEQLFPRVNVQRRTINNWRNNKSTPRSIDDQQFKLVALALKLSDDDLKQIFKFIETDVGLSVETETKTNLTINSKSLKWILVGLAGVLIVVTAIAFLTNNGSKITYLDQIPPTQLRVSETGFVIPNSETKVISERILETLSGWELYVARNELFARKGRPFVKVSSMCLQKHFDSWAKTEANPNGWYSKKSGDVRLSDLEYRNAEIIRNYECKARGGQYNCSGQLNECY